MYCRHMRNIYMRAVQSPSALYPARLSLNARNTLHCRKLCISGFQISYLIQNTCDHRKSSLFISSGIGNNVTTISSSPLALPLPVFWQQKRYAGHSKWANIKHTKAAKDGARAAQTGKLMQKIRVAIREGGNANPNANLQLSRVIQQAYEKDVPKTVVENTIKNAVEANKNANTVYYDAKGPGGSMLLIEALTSSPKKTKNSIYAVFKKHGGQMNDRSMAAHFFEQRGVIFASPSGNIQKFDEAEEAAIMAEAEDVEETLDDDGNPVFQFLCDPKSGHGLQKTLADQNPEVNFSSPSLRYFAKVHQTMPEEAVDHAVKIVDALENVEDIVRVYTNIKAEEKT